MALTDTENRPQEPSGSLLPLESQSNPFRVKAVPAVESSKAGEKIETWVAAPTSAAGATVTLELPRTSEELRDYLQSGFRDEALSHPVFDLYLGHSLQHVQAYPDWLMRQSPMDLTQQELDQLSSALQSLGVNEYNLEETQRLMTAVELAQAEKASAGQDFQKKVERYDQLLDEMSAVAADQSQVTETLAQRVFSDEERDRALQYHRGLYQREAAEKTATGD